MGFFQGWKVRTLFFCILQTKLKIRNNGFFSRGFKSSICNHSLYYYHSNPSTNINFSLLVPPFQKNLPQTQSFLSVSFITCTSFGQGTSQFPEFLDHASWSNSLLLVLLLCRHQSGLLPDLDSLHEWQIIWELNKRGLICWNRILYVLQQKEGKWLMQYRVYKICVFLRI